MEVRGRRPASPLQPPEGLVHWKFRGETFPREHTSQVEIEISLYMGADQTPLCLLTSSGLVKVMVFC